jgi:hypothetical protein
MCYRTAEGRPLSRLRMMKSTKDLKKSIVDFFKRKKKTTFGAVFLALTIFIENLTTFIQDEIAVIDRNDREIQSHEMRIKELEQYRTSKDVVIEETVGRTSFNAYISRQDGEYHLQQQKNDEFTEKLGNLTGRVGELETITYELNENAINGGKYENGDPN